MKDQSPVDVETKQDKWDRGKTLFLESVHKPDHQLRSCAHNQKCYNELMEIRDQVIEMVHSIPNPYIPAGTKNKVKVPSYNGISLTLLGGSLGKHYMKDWTEEQIEEYNKMKD
jgi:hypothetical protein|tara:strand:- start:188 stop:526 length:339 start_codon:yes stop_codon:yes gene_type:complete